MGLMDALLGRKLFCDVCGAPIREKPLEGRDGSLFCSRECMATIERLSQAPSTPVPSTRPETPGANSRTR